MSRSTGPGRGTPWWRWRRFLVHFRPPEVFGPEPDWVMVREGRTLRVIRSKDDT